MTESGAQRLQRGAPAGGEGRRRALWRQQQEPPSPRPPLPPPPAARCAGRTGGTGPAAALLPGLRRRARCLFKSPGGGGRCSLPRPALLAAAASAPSPPGLWNNGPGRAAAGSPAGPAWGRGSVSGRCGAALLCAALAAAFPAPCRPRRGGRGCPPPAPPLPPGAPGLDAGGHRGAPAGRCLAAERGFPRVLARGEVAGAGASLRFPPSHRAWGRRGQTGGCVSGTGGVTEHPGTLGHQLCEPGSSSAAPWLVCRCRLQCGLGSVLRQGEAAGLWRAGLCEAVLGTLWMDCQMGAYKLTCQKE